MKLITQPDDGVAPLISAIKSAKESIDLAIFRFDHYGLEKALTAAVARGVKVNALVASVNHGGEKSLRKLEMRFLEVGMTVSRSASELIRYHDKVMIIDKRLLFVLSFNFTHMDIDRSRGFGIVTDNSKWVAEGLKLLEADCKRMSYEAALDTFVVSPSNSRKVLGDFLKGATKQLLIYDPKISDKEMSRILQERIKAGVELRFLGQTKADLPVKKMAKLRLHTRTIIRDGRQAFVGSQSLRTAELDSRREVGLIVNDPKIVKQLVATFDADWSANGGKEQASEKISEKAKDDPDKAIKILIEELNPIAATVKKAVRKVVDQAGDEIIEDGTVRETVKEVVKRVVKEAVKEAVKA